MKKLFCAILAVALMFTFAALAEQETQTYNWSDYESLIDQLGAKGNFYEYKNKGFKLWIPESLAQFELTEDQINSGWIDVFSTEDQNLSIIVQFNQVEDVNTLQEFEKYAEGQYEASSYAVINNFDVLMLLRKQGDTMTVVIPGEDNYFLQITYNGMTEQAFKNLTGISLASIQPM